jgi:glycosyltransferase involved in cell wall biosynthesis
MRVIAFVSKEKGISPGQRFRLEQWAPHLECEHGITIDFVPFESPALTRALRDTGNVPQKAAYVLRDFALRSAHVRRATSYDAAIVFREVSLIGPALYERVLRALGVPFVVDFDDAIWIAGTDGNNGLFAHLRFPKKTATMCRLASAVSVGNQYLADYARAQNTNVHIVPTTIDLDHYAVQPELSDEQPFTVLWSGSTPTLAHFETARGALEKFARTRDVVVKVICNKPPQKPIAGARNEFVQWRPEGEAEAIGACHVGIMPLPDDEFSRGKCGLKALQYMATGRAAIVAPVGMNRDLVEHNVNGMLASTEVEWLAALNKLADDHALRRTLGAAGRKTVEESFSARAGAAKYAALLQGIARKR